jgi:hypothetical protein
MNTLQHFLHSRPPGSAWVKAARDHVALSILGLALGTLLPCATQAATSILPAVTINNGTTNVSGANGRDDNFGYALAPLPGGRFAASLPYLDRTVSRGGGILETFTNAGSVRIYDSNGVVVKTLVSPSPANDDLFGRGLATLRDGSLVVGSPGRDIFFISTIPNVGEANLFDPNGNWVRTFANGNGIFGANDSFGSTIAACGTNHFAVGLSGRTVAGKTGAGMVFVYSAASNNVVANIPNPTPDDWESFGISLCGLGDNKLVIGAVGSHEVAVNAGSVYIYSLDGTLLKPIHCPTERANESFGWTVARFGTNHFLVAAPSADVVYASGNGFVTNYNAGIVYLYDENGTLVKTFQNPDPAQSSYFGYLCMAQLDDDRFIVGASSESVSGQPYAGRAYIFNTDGVHLQTIANPAPNSSDYFGWSMAAINDHQFVIGAPYDDTKQTNAGSAYIYDVPIERFEIGSEIPRPASVDIAAPFPALGPKVEPAGATYWHVPSQKLYLIKSGDFLVSWKLQNGTTNNVQAFGVWPTNQTRYQTFVAGSPAVDLTDQGLYPTTLLLNTSGGVDDHDLSSNHRFLAGTPGRSLLLLSTGDPSVAQIRFQLIKAIDWADIDYLHDNAPAVIGQEIVDTFGYHDPAASAPWVVQSNSVHCAAAHFYDRSTRSGPIIAVNKDRPGDDSDDLVVAYYKKGTKLYNPATGLTVSNNLMWPYQPVRYRPNWPTNPPTIVIASQRGTEVIDPAVFKNWDLYFENSSNAPGFNPNDEHALRRPYDSGEAIFALRDDLGSTNTSLPYVLMTYQDPVSNVGKIKVWRVVAEQAPWFFNYQGEAGKLIQPPFPLSGLQLCQESDGVSGPYWRDRKLGFWARAAGKDGGTSNVVMRYFYALQTNFFLPSFVPALPVGAHLPWLDLHAGTPGIPQNIAYTISWPTNAAELHVGETLVKPKHGLPDIAQQKSVEIIYQQSSAQGHGPSAKVIDPTQERQVFLSNLPADVATVNESGIVYFPTLPPQLRGRFRYDPAAQNLIFKGQFIEPVAGDYYTLLNVITAREKTILLGLSSNPQFQAAVNALATVASNTVDILPNATGVDSKALTAGFAQGTGYVTLAFGNSTNVDQDLPVSVEVIEVTCPPYKGDIKAILSANPFDEKVTLRHSGDFAGRTDQYIFEWRTLPPDPNTGQPSATPPGQWNVFNPVPPNGQGAVDITLQGAGLQTLSDNYFVCRYRPTDTNNPCGTGWSEWTAPMLAEGWIKRVLNGINPFEQKIQSYQNNSVNTIVSMVSQAGARWVGNVPLNQQAADSFGLIEIYETILKRGIGLSIEGTPAVNYPPANDALLLAAGRIADLYMLLGNEAFADAADPTIAFGTDDGTYGSQATSIHCFMNQTSSLLEEELALLRGRDDSLQPSVQTYPVYNRLIWNFTHDINGGETAYALNYNIQDQNGDVAGTIDEADAKALYPQGHGDAWGHYLTAIKNYYHLLRSTNFTWMPRSEAVLVGGVPVSVDYLDERKFAHAAASRAQTGAEIVNLTYRHFYVEDPKGQYQGYQDANTNRAWGLAEWGGRAAQGALFDWIVANAILPAQSTNSGIQKVDRTTVKELADIASSLADIQVQVDNADRGLNPLGLAKDVLPFDIDPAAIIQGKTHFEQIYDRAVKALNNAIAVFDHANNCTQLLRRQADNVEKFKDTVSDREADFNSRLIEIFGYPYADDIGGAGAYPAGYVGPDIYHYDYVDASALLGANPPPSQNLNVLVKDFTVNTNGALGTSTKLVSFNIAPHGLGLIKPVTWVGQRQAPGEIQMARSDLIQARGRFEKSLADYDKLLNDIEDQSAVLVAQFNANAAEIEILNAGMNTQKSLLDQINEARDKQKFFNTAANTAKRLADALAEHLPKSAGTSMDPTSVARGALMVMGTISSELLSKQADKNAELEQEHIQAKEIEQYLTNIRLTSVRNDAAFLHQLAQLEQMVRQETSLRLEIFTLNEAMQQSSGRYLAALSKGIRLLDDRLRFRRQTAAQIQSYRYKDMAFRIFRNDALQKYRAQFDLAARYVYMAARAYDFETCLSQGDPRGPGEKFLTDIIRSRALGLVQNQVPLTGPAHGDGGLADPMARMWLDWDLVLKGQLGFNNAQTETGRFSLRSENFRVQPGFAGNTAWRQVLTSLVVSNLIDLPEFQRYCIPFQPMLPVEPGIVIPFSTTVNFGQNFFGWPAGGGDNDYDSTHFATKIRSVGVWFANYNNLGGGMINTPRVYLVPVGNDILRSPTGGLGKIRQWAIVDQLLPVPFPLSGNSLSDPAWIPINDTLVGDLGEIRKFARFRAYHDSGTFEPSETINDSRLIGRSVWNTRWLLIIPAGSLHSDRTEGLERFINGALVNGQRDGNGVSDIKIFFQTYAYSGN